MPPRHRFYDPEIQTAVPAAEPLPPVDGLIIERPGVYLHAEAVSATLARMALLYHGEGRSALLEAARSFADAGVEEPPEELLVVETPHDPLVKILQAPFPFEPPDAHPEVARVEVYPNEDGSYWYARVVTAEGEILLGETEQGINSGLVEEQAARRWPGKPVYEIADAMGDSIWDEQAHTFGFNGRRRPSPRRLWST